jgi:tetratricopeptide (TPR) repeat protein
MKRFLAVIALFLFAAGVGAALGSERGHKPTTAQVTLRAPGAGCVVDLDNDPAGKADAHGLLILAEVEPGDHYLHLRCPGDAERTFFLSPRPGDKVTVDAGKPQDPSEPQTGATADPIEVRLELNKLIQQATQLRAQGKLDEAVEPLRQALKLDPDNSDLHRELGITFLLDKDWQRARVEMLEAVRHDPTDADAYNGLGYALEKMGDLEEAMKDYHKATQLDPDDPTYRTHYFDVMSKLAQEKSKKK